MQQKRNTRPKVRLKKNLKIAINREICPIILLDPFIKYDFEIYQFIRTAWK